MGPCLWGTEYRMIRDRIKWANELQWGRAFGARNTLILLILLVATTSFNGAVPLGHGIQHHHVHREQRQQRFNGAVPLGHGIPLIRSLVSLAKSASMGPCLWGTEYGCWWPWAALNRSTLQWGRAFGARNTSTAAFTMFTRD